MVNGGGEFEINNASDVTSKVDPGRKRTIRVVARRVRVGPGAHVYFFQKLEARYTYIVPVTQNWLLLGERVRFSQD